jgi:hypothetical protein
MLAGGLLVLAACGRDAGPGDGVGQALYGLTVIDAVQLGAAQGCHSLAGTVEGSLSIRQLEDSDGLVLLLEDDYPLCIDTMDHVAGELEKIEATYMGRGPTGTMSTDDVEQLMVGAEQMGGSDPDGTRETDPNPQPADPQPAPAGILTTTADVQSPEGPTSPPDPPPESSD